MKKFVSGLLLLCMLFTCLTAVAEDAAEDAAASQPAPVFQTADGVLSIQAPNATWVEIQEPDLWFAMTDGDDYILIDHLSNGEVLSATTLADDEFAAVYDACVSTPNEVFHIIGCAVDKESLKDIMQAIATIKILQFDTKQAIQKVAAPVTEFTVDEYNDVLYCTSKHLNVRSSWTVKSPRLGYLKKGEAVQVTGIVRRNGRDFGWYRINYNGGDAFVSAKYLKSTQPKGGSKTSAGSDDALDNPPGVDAQDPEAYTDAGYALDHPEHVDAQDPEAYTNAGYALDNPEGADSQDPLAD